VAPVSRHGWGDDVSTFAYAQITKQRMDAKPNASTSTDPPGVRTWVDALAALVPAEVLAAHATLIGYMTKINPGQPPTTVITGAHTLIYVFYSLFGLAILLYVVARLKAGKWDKWDYARMLIPGLAFVGWTMLQRTTAFDAAWPAVREETRTAVALIGAIVLGVIASALAYQADQKQA
jgi:hypothetical protein